MQEKTTRQQIAELLRHPVEGTGLKPSEIASHIERDIDAQDVVKHIRHLNESEPILKAPPECQECSFSNFNKLDPSKCPNCKSRRVKEAEFRIKNTRD